MSADEQAFDVGGVDRELQAELDDDPYASYSKGPSPELAPVPCKFCGVPTRMAGTEQCDNCWEVHSRLDTMSPEILEAILLDLGKIDKI